MNALQDEWAECVEWRWALRGFFSADLAGATALKYREPKLWLRSVTGFYRTFSKDFGEHVGEAWNRAPSESREPPEPVLWKGLGDELVFVVEFRCLDHVLASVAGFASAVRAYNESVERSDDPASRPVKATAWSAGFPLSNRAYSLDPPATRTSADVLSPSRSGPAPRGVEFIGPSMDLGFRLCKISAHAPDRVVLSPDLAWLVLRAVHECHWMEKEFRWVYAGRTALEGVRLGDPVPNVMLNLLPQGETAPAEARLLGRDSESCRAGDLYTFLKGYVPKSEHWPRLPLIHSDSRTHLSQKDMDNLEKERREVKEMADAASLTYEIEGTKADQKKGDPSRIRDLPSVPSKSEGDERGDVPGRCAADDKEG